MPDQPVPRHAHVHRGASSVSTVGSTGVRHKMVEQGERVPLHIFTATRVAIFLQSVVAAIVTRDHFRYPVLAGCVLAVLLVEGVFVIGIAYRRGILDSYRLVALDLLTSWRRSGASTSR